MTAANKRQAQDQIDNVDRRDDSRWMERYPEERANISLYELVDAQNVRAREIAANVDGNNLEHARELAKIDAPLKTISDLLAQSGVPIDLTIRAGDEVVASKNGSPPFSVAQLSDGERNALLIAANVLTAPAGSLLLIDEPERHLHRSIISPFLTLLFAKRPDCTFVVSTHDVELAAQSPTSQVLLVRGCTYGDGGIVSAWDVDLVSSEADIDEELKAAILGSRRKVLFVEGTNQSLDHSLYGIIFPGVSVVPKGGCVEVESSVAGIRGSPDLHWITACGLVDNDRRTAAEIDRLRQRGIHATTAHSIESIYFDPEVQRRLAIRQTGLLGGDPQALIDEAKQAAVRALTPHRARLAARAVEKAVVEEVRRQQPTQETITARQLVNIAVDVPALLAAEEEAFDAAVRENNLESLIARYPIRETAALAEISRRLGFQDRSQYERAVRKLLMDDEEAFDAVRLHFVGLIAEMGI